MFIVADRFPSARIAVKEKYYATNINSLSLLKKISKSARFCLVCFVSWFLLLFSCAQLTDSRPTHSRSVHSEPERKVNRTFSWE